MTHNFPNNLIINVDQTPLHHAHTENVTMAEKHSKGASDKYGITVTLAGSMCDEVLPMQLIYKEKTNRSLPLVEFPAGFVVLLTLEQ